MDWFQGKYDLRIRFSVGSQIHQSPPVNTRILQYFYSVHPLLTFTADDGEESRLSQAEQGLSSKYEQLLLQTFDSTIFFWNTPGGTALPTSSASFLWCSVIFLSIQKM